MKFLILTLAVGLAAGDIGLTYNNFRVPETTYGVPNYQYSSGNDYNTGYSGAEYNYKAENGAQADYQTGFQSASSLGSDAGFNYAGNFQGADHTGQFYNTGDLNSINTITPGQQSNGAGYQYNDAGYQYNDASQSGYNYQTTSQYQESAVQKYQQFYKQYQQQPAQVFKHFYVHAAPEEPEEPKKVPQVVLPPPQKHYKIIFIKAPSQTVYQPQYIPVPQPNEEKTIVYVLVKKPEEQQEVVIPKVEQKAPTKPEVFFIKYNNKADSQAVINNIVSDYNKAPANFVLGGPTSGYYNVQTQGSGQYSQGTTGQYSQGTGQYTQGQLQGTGQYSQGSGQSGQYNKGTAGQYTQGQLQGTGQYSQGSGQSGQYNKGTAGQYTQGQLQGTGQYTQGSGQSGQYNKGTAGQYTQGSYNQYAGQGSQGTTAGYTGVQFGGQSSSTSASSTSGYSSSEANTASNSNFGSTISTSQGVPHETYGPPKFKV